MGEVCALGLFNLSRPLGRGEELAREPSRGNHVEEVVPGGD